MVEKLDARYKWYRQGFRYRIVIGVRSLSALNHWIAIAARLEETYGKERYLNANGFLVFNDYYRTDMPSKRCRQVYLRSEQDLTMLLLVINQ